MSVEAPGVEQLLSADAKRSLANFLMAFVAAHRAADGTIALPELPPTILGEANGTIDNGS